jgi:hypothetical protein
MASDIQLNDNAVVVEGNVGIGTSNPVRKLHVEGSEVHSGGPVSGFSIGDRTMGNERRWVLYSEESHLRVWAQTDGTDKLVLHANGDMFVTRDLHVEGKIRLKDHLNVGKEGKIFGRLGGNQSGKHSLIRMAATAITLNPPNSSITDPPKFALMHDAVNSQKDALVINHGSSFKDGVRIDGNVQVTGALTQASSAALKENVAALSGPEALAALQGLQAVKYTYKADETKAQRLGFIAEDVPELVATAQRDRLSPMDLIAVLTKAVQELQQTITAMAAEMGGLKEQLAGGTP